MKEPWDLVIAHPPCTYLSKARGKFPCALLEHMMEAIDFFIDCYKANAPRVAIENPMLYRAVTKIIGRPDFYCQPWEFGDWYLKQTGWWLRGLPPLLASVAGLGQECKDNMPSLIDTKSRRKKLPVRPKIGGPKKYRSRFHPGMAKAMAKQWGSYNFKFNG